MNCRFKVWPDVFIEPEKEHATGLGRESGHTEFKLKYLTSNRSEIHKRENTRNSGRFFCGKLIDNYIHVFQERVSEI